jgi:general secretion pathway protein A
MSSIEYRPQRPAPFEGLPDARFFYGNLFNLEVLAALRFGIEARKGLILFTGDAGSGKSALLQQLARELNPKAACILVTDAEVRVSEVLKRIVATLGSAAVPDDSEPALILRCQTALRSQREANRIVSVVFDDAQDLADEVIESLAAHFLGKGFDPDDNLLQIVLAGRPELRKRLLTPPLSSLGTQVEIECRLRPLDAKEIGPYINHRLGAADLPRELFGHDAIERIADYSDGRPAAVNAICHRALELETPSPAGKITSDAVARAARDLKLSKPGRGRARARQKSPNIAALDLSSAAPAATVAFQTSVLTAGDEDRGRSLLPVRTKSWAIPLALIFALAAAAWLAVGPVSNSGMDRIAKLEPDIVSENESAAPENSPSNAAASAGPEDSGAAALPGPDVAPLSVPQSANRGGARTRQTPEVPPGAAANRSAAGLSLSRPPHREPAEFPPKAAAERATDHARQVAKAIETRAIRGVTVSVVDGIAYLDGTVASREQKAAAERAARGVSEVREIRNRIAVE